MIEGNQSSSGAVPQPEVSVVRVSVPLAVLPEAAAVELSVDPAPVVGAPAASPQVAALCWRLHKGQVQVLLVTSRETGRWVLPKGWPMQGLTAEAAAAREAWEEAGVHGKISAIPIGSYCYDKILRDTRPLGCAVAVYPLRVHSLKPRFPERKQRRRKWFSAEIASHHVAEPDLAELLLHLTEAPEVLSPTTAPKRSKASAR